MSPAGARRGRKETNVGCDSGETRWRVGIDLMGGLDPSTDEVTSAAPRPEHIAALMLRYSPSVS